MSDLGHLVATTSKRCPASVTISSHLLQLVAALQVISVGMVLPATGAVLRYYKEVFPNPYSYDSVEQLRIFYSETFLYTMISTSVAAMIATVGLAIVAAFIRRGKPAARVVTLVLGGLYSCCYAGLSFVFGAGNAIRMGAPDDWDWPDERNAELRQMLEDRFPSWYDPTSTALLVLTLIALLVALILLTLPASNAFFHAGPQTISRR
ncbi:hypothetical protein O7626_09880 [Micromonospora sp. WMMD1102]|uniref:hypothetical protein n=1 Tax=Micromonospora sp. WMMD1102 TaxID=3016105 RepID=UPI0024151273|nr:hypothetical protein [Micromonospora sp. WMMD1102]MDG4786232.1 hypothetical protein [Micromonospora sp. WMMD1102]